jgi:glycerol-3-phosphate dehydrogenase
MMGSEIRPMLNQTRSQVWQNLTGEQFDLIVIGGGITGAGILREAQRAGWRALLVEAKDYAWGTSSRSSKMVHGGLRYLQQGQLKVMFESVRERERLLKEAPGLVDPLGFLIPVYGSWKRKITYRFGLTVYDLCAGRNSHQEFSRDEMLKRVGFLYQDAQTDDARLVMRLIKDAVREGAMALNYSPVQTLLMEGGMVTGIEIENALTQEKQSVKASVVVNATGANTDFLRKLVGGRAVVRPLRGSHLVFSEERLPLTDVVAFNHPADARNVFAYPWRGHVLLGTTDLDDRVPLDSEPRIAQEEVDYLIAAARFAFPDLDLKIEDVTATWAGVRPVIGTGKSDPSKESRDSMVIKENGLISVSGGKLTTFRTTAHHVLNEAAQYLNRNLRLSDGPIFEKLDPDLLPAKANKKTLARLAGFYGKDATSILQSADEADLVQLGETSTLKAELKFSAQFEDVVHLEDLMLRRARFGFVLSKGGESLLSEVRDSIQSILGWSDQRWDDEEKSYKQLIEQSYSLSQAQR